MYSANMVNCVRVETERERERERKSEREQKRYNGDREPVEKVKGGYSDPIACITCPLKSI